MARGPGEWDISRVVEGVNLIVGYVGNRYVVRNKRSPRHSQWTNWTLEYQPGRGVLSNKCVFKFLRC